MKRTKNRKVLLALLPFWDPQIPPLGIACLKTHLQQHGTRVKTVDFNLIPQFRDIIKTYFETLKSHLPNDKIGNYYKIAHEVMQNHFMAHVNYKEEKRYLELLNTLVYKTFYTTVDTSVLLELCDIAADFYTRLQKAFLELLEREQPEVLGISVFGGTLPASLYAFRIAKEKYPRLKTVMGGAVFSDYLHTDSPNFKRLLEYTAPYIDKIIIGEGEMLFLNYITGQLPDSQKVFQLKDVNNNMLDISSAGIPDFSDFDTRFYPYMSAYTSRSCPFQCSFCSETVIWGKYRKKGAAQIAKELMHLREKYNSQLFMLGDSLINPVVTPMSETLNQNDASVYFDAYLRADPDVCDTRNTMVWRHGGFYRARLGIESASPNVLGIMGKKTTPQRIKDALSSLAMAGIKTTSYWVVGHPGETEEDFRETLDFIERNQDDIYEADCTPFQYFLTGQANSEYWAGYGKAVKLYPPAAEDMIIFQTWTLESEPDRRKAYSRMNRFVRHCEQVGVPNPYSLKETYLADERWQKIQKNAVPPIVEFSGDKPVSESRQAKQLVLAKEKPGQLNAIDFDF